MDAAFNITAYSEELIRDQNAATVAAVLENDSSVRFTTNTGHVNENYVIRGFDVNASEVAFNGLYGLAPDSHVPTEMIERVELLKGPGALLGGMAPSGAVGGVVNVVSKKPLATFTTPPTAPLGAMPPSSAPGPLSSSTRSIISVGTWLSGASPYRPLKATSLALTSKPRIT